MSTGSKKELGRRVVGQAERGKLKWCLYLLHYAHIHVHIVLRRIITLGVLCFLIIQFYVNFISF